MKKCELCGFDNPDQARFCMKCAKDLDAVESGQGPREADAFGTFIPAASGDNARLAPTANAGPPAAGSPIDIEMYKQEAAASIESYENQVASDSDEPPEIQLSGVAADFAEKQRYCDQCGHANPKEQRYCQQCGQALRVDAFTPAMNAPRPSTMIPLATEPSKPNLLAGMAGTAPASDYYSEGAPGTGSPRKFGSGSGFAGALGVREIIVAIVGVLIIFTLVYLFVFGGYGTLLGGKAKKIRGVAGVMQRLPSFQYNITAAFETADGAQYGGSGKLLFETPDKTYWELSLGTPGKPGVTASMQIGDKVYGNGPAWQTVDPGQSTADALGLWRDFSSVEDLGTQAIGTANCLHYKYRIHPKLISTALGVGAQSGASDAVVEVWIDGASSTVVKMTVQVFNVMIQGASTNVTMTFDLAATGQPYNIKAPQ